MKIALVARHASAPARQSDEYAGDQAAHVTGLGKALASQGHHVVIYARKDAPGLPDRETLATRLTVRYITAGPPAPPPPHPPPRHAAPSGPSPAARREKDAPHIVHPHPRTSSLPPPLAAPRQPRP